jgi:parallel beta-helix repeat protein
MKSRWRVFCVTSLVISAATGSLLLSEEVRAGTPVVGDIVVDTIWSPLNSPYWIETDVTVLPGVELIVSAGTEVRFNGVYMLVVEGKLLVQGSAIDPVVFTHNSSTPSPGEWATIYVLGEAHVNYANVSYAHFGIYLDSLYNTVNDSYFYRNNLAILSGGFGFGNLIRNNTVYDSTFCGIQVWRDSNEIIGNNVTGSGDTGICLAGAKGNLVQQNTLYRNSWNGIRIDSHSSSNVILENNVLESQTYQGIGVWESDGNWILNNTIRGNRNNGIYLEQSSGNNISWNEIMDSGNYHGVSLYLADSNLMVGNLIYGVRLSGIYVESSTGNRILENTVHDNLNGISVYGCPMTEISGNNITSNSDGIDSAYSPLSDISSNTISWNDNFGIHSQDNNDISVVNNVFLWNTGNALQALFSNLGVISDNDFVGNGMGVFLMNSSNVTMLGNNFTSNNIYGVLLSFSSDVSIYHNSFINNTNQAADTNNADMYPLTSPFPPLIPMPPLPFGAVLTGNDFENVSLAWNLSPDDGQRLNSVVRYDIYRNDSYDSDGLGYQFHGSVPNGTSQFVDVQAGEGDPNNHFYRICAVDTDNDTRCSGEQLAKFTVSLDSGPNLVSIPLVQSNMNLQTVFQTLFYDNARSYDPINRKWKSFMKSKPYSQSLGDANHTIGIWVNVTQGSNLTIAGVVPTSTTINLHAGWNLVGFPSFNNSYAVANLKATMAVDRIEGFDGAAPPYFLRAMTDGDFLQAGFGYWIKTSNDATWIVTNS